MVCMYQYGSTCREDKRGGKRHQIMDRSAAAAMRRCGAPGACLHQGTLRQDKEFSTCHSVPRRAKGVWCGEAALMFGPWCCGARMSKRKQIDQSTADAAQ